MNLKTKVFFIALGCAVAVPAAIANPSGSDDPTHLIEVKASTREQRSKLADLGYALEDLRSDRVFVIGHEADADRIRAAGFKATAAEMPPRLFSGEGPMSTRYHNYEQVSRILQDLERNHSNIVTLLSLGRSVQNRDIPMLRISGKSLAQAETDKTPVVFYMGCHHAREHLSVEVPLMFAQYLIDNYGKNPGITRLVDSREIYVAPMINPDGHTYDFTGNQRGRMWRKNRSRNNDGSYGVDLNRNYGYRWGTGGSSSDPESEVYMGPTAFSEPETRAVRDFINAQPRMTTLLTVHTFSELVLYPWGYTYNPVGPQTGGTETDRRTFEKMARDMAAWNHYTPENSSSLYITSGDVTDWAYGTRGIFGFTFELSPTSMFNGGFYPGDAAIDPTFNANIRPMLYLLEFADNPRRTLTQRAPNFLSTPSARGIPVADYRDALH